MFEVLPGEAVPVMYLANILQRVPNAFPAIPRFLRASESAAIFFGDTAIVPEEDFSLCLNLDAFDFFMFALRGKAGLALGSLISSKLNQWTLLVGMIPGVYGVSAGTFAHPIPLNGLQMHEITLTAAQSLLAVGLLAGLRLTIRGAALLFVLFAGQFLAPTLPDALWRFLPGHLNGTQVHYLFSFLYVATFLALLPRNGRQLLALLRPSALKRSCAAK